MTKQKVQPSRLAQALLEAADDMRDVGIIDAASHEKITLRHLGPAAPAIEPLTGDEIRAMRERARLSQAVFARCLNLTVGYVSQIERGTKRPSGPVLVLLNLIRRKGIKTLL
jgi:putative transcriptional regulator